MTLPVQADHPVTGADDVHLPAGHVLETCSGLVKRGEGPAYRGDADIAEVLAAIRATEVRTTIVFRQSYALFVPECACTALETREV